MCPIMFRGSTIVNNILLLTIENVATAASKLYTDNKKKEREKIK